VGEAADIQEKFTVSELEDRRAGDGDDYLEFLRRESMSCGLYVLEAGALDEQVPHNEDEIYVVVGGRASFTAGSANVEVTAGSILYVPSLMVHRFHDITERLTTLVFFAPAESQA
jgi:mannose-6-phosphate isomerase-like protein (cupin superfamily)